MPDSKPYILLLTAKPDGWPSARFREAAKKARIPIRAANPAKAMLETCTDDGGVRFSGRRIAEPMVVLPRLGPGNYENGLMVLAQYESAAIPVCNSSIAIELAHDTYKSLLKLESAGIRVPHTARVLSIKDIKLARKSVPGPPWIVKTFTGAMGIGTMLVREIDQLEAIAATLWALGQPVLIQEYFLSRDATISDTRVLIIGNSILGAIRRSAQAGEFRANVHQGGLPEAIELGADERKLALKVARTIGLDIAGVDWIDTSDGPMVLEINATPGFQGFEQATGIDAAGAMIKFALSKAGMK